MIDVNEVGMKSVRRLNLDSVLMCKKMMYLETLNLKYSND